MFSNTGIPKEYLIKGYRSEMMSVNADVQARPIFDHLMTMSMAKQAEDVFVDLSIRRPM
jgi:hypothetical protein